MTSRERVLRALDHRVPDRVPVQDSPWPATLKRWRAEGMPEDVPPAEYFGYEFESFGSDLTPRFPVTVVEKNDEYVVSTTPQGGKRRNHLDYSTTPEIVDWPVRTKDDWKAIKARLKPDFTRVNWASDLARNKTAVAAGRFCTFGNATGYDLLQGYMKSEQLLIAMVEDPAWVKEMIMVHAELIIVTAELMIKNGFSFDAAFVYNDMGYRNAALFSPDAYMKTHFEADRLLFGYFHSKNMKTILHSCGNMQQLIPHLIEAGLDCLQPLEVKAGMDLPTLKGKYGDRLAFMGGIDTRLMADPDPEKIEREIAEKFAAAKKNGGYIYHSDHSIPTTVSLEQYRRVMELVRKHGVYEEYVEEAPAAAPAAPAAAAAGTVPAPEKKKGFGLFGGKKAAAPRPAPAPAPAKPAAPAAAPKPAAGPKKSPFAGLFGKKEKK